jgi:N-dimethylarginine dimethylaminohydrolase
MCPPTYFDVIYAINAWMRPETKVDTELAQRQWEALRRTYLDLGHEVRLIDAVPGLPDMVFVTDSGVVVDGVAMGARYRAAQRAPEADHVLRWFSEHGVRRPVAPVYLNEGEGDFLVVGDVILAGTGFRTDERAHAELGRHLNREVVTLRLVDPRYYHLNTALGVLDGRTIAYLPHAFAPDSVRELRRRYPDALIADDADGGWLGLNLVSDGRHVVMAQQAAGLMGKVAAAGFVPVPLDFSEFRKSGGGIKCCTLELRGVPPTR